MSTVDDVHNELMSRLVRGEMVPGDRLRQDDIADQLGVSKIPVREALQRLTATGLLRFESNRGAVVPALTAAEAEENYGLRRAIEPQLLARALPNLTVVDLAEAQLALDADHLSLTESNWHFHRALYRSSHWQRGLAVAEMLHAAVAPYVLLYTEGLGGAVDSDAEHLELLDLCRSGDVDAARGVLDRHLDRAEEVLVAFLSDLGSAHG